MKQKSPYTIHTDPRNAIVRDGAILIIGPGQVAFRGRKGNLTPEDLADAWTLATILRDGDDAQAVPDGAALREQLEQMRKLLVYHLCDCGRDMPPEPHLHAVDCRYRRAVESVEVS
jgi:hypothetical protein